MILFISIALFCLVLGSVTVFGHRAYVRPGRVLDQFGSFPSDTIATEETGLPQGESPLPVRVLQQVGQQIPVSPQNASIQKRFLIGAGFRSDSAIQILYGAKAVGGVLFFLLAFFVLRPLMPDIALLRIVLIIGSVVLGFFGPNFVLERMVKSRQERLRLGLPDALDLMVVCVEAGLGLDQAIMTVSRELKNAQPDIADELSLVNLEMRAGTRRADALRHLASRTGEDEIRKLVAIMIQTDRFGTSMGDSLRTHSDFMRVRRRQQAEERASKVGVKLVFPIFFFILPSMFIVSAGPGILNIFKYLLPMMKNMSGGQ